MNELINWLVFIVSSPFDYLLTLWSSDNLRTFLPVRLSGLLYLSLYDTVKNQLIQYRPKWLLYYRFPHKSNAQFNITDCNWWFILNEFHIYFAIHGSVPSNLVTKVCLWIRFWGPWRGSRLYGKERLTFVILMSTQLVRIFKLGYCVTNITSRLLSPFPKLYFLFLYPGQRTYEVFCPVNSPYVLIPGVV